MPSSTSSSDRANGAASVASDRSVQVLALVAAALLAWAILRPDLALVGGWSTRGAWLARKSRREPHSAALVVAGNSRILFGVHADELAARAWKADGIAPARTAVNFAFPAARYSRAYLDSVDAQLEEGPRTVVLLGLGARNFVPDRRDIGFEYYARLAAEGKLEPPGAFSLRTAAIPVNALWRVVSGDAETIRWRKLGREFERPDGSFAFRLDADEHGRAHDLLDPEPQARAESAAVVANLADLPDRRMIEEAGLDPALVDALLERVSEWVRRGVRVTFVRMPDRGEANEGDLAEIPPRRSSTTRPQAMHAVQAALAARGAIALRPSFEGLVTWDDSHMDEASAATFTRRVGDELARVQGSANGDPTP